MTFYQLANIKFLLVCENHLVYLTYVCMYNQVPMPIVPEVIRTYWLIIINNYHDFSQCKLI